MFFRKTLLVSFILFFSLFKNVSANFFNNITDLIENNYESLRYGISVTDFNNDGNLDIVFTGEDENGNPVSELHIGENFIENLPASGGYSKSSIELLGLRESTVDWVDYDMDGDDDLFISMKKQDESSNQIILINQNQFIFIADLEIEVKNQLINLLSWVFLRYTT